jgi:clan AA aspartic protease (TIGR02281 family)
MQFKHRTFVLTPAPAEGIWTLFPWRCLPLIAGVAAAASLLVAWSPPRTAAAQAAAPPPAHAASETQAERDGLSVPITVDDRHIYVDVMVNGQPARFVLDTGAGGNVITPEAARKFGLSSTQKASAVGTADRVDAGVVTLKRLAVGTAVLEDEPIFIIPLPEALQADGLIGYPFLRRFVVTLDWPNSRLLLTMPGRFKAPDGAAALPIRLKENIPTVEGEVDGNRGWFEVDTGANSAMTLYPRFIEQHGLRDRYSPRIRTITGRGVGGLNYGDYVRVGAVTLGPFSLKGTVVQLSRQQAGSDAKSDLAGRIGNEILDRFTLTLDYPHKRLILTKNGRFDAPFVGLRSGLRLDYDTGVFTAVDVVLGSPAAEAGIATGDQVIAVNGTPVSKVTPKAIASLLLREPGTQITMIVRTGETGKPREVTITLRDML